MLPEARSGYGSGSGHIARWELLPHYRRCWRRTGFILHGHQTAKRNPLVSNAKFCNKSCEIFANYFYRQGPDGKTMSSENHLHTRLVNRHAKYIFLPPTGVTTWARQALKINHRSQLNGATLSDRLCSTLRMWTSGMMGSTNFVVPNRTGTPLGKTISDEEYSSFLTSFKSLMLSIQLLSSGRRHTSRWAICGRS